MLNLAYNALCDGTCLEDIELRRNDEAFLDALGARRIPDPTTAGDFCRRFQPEDVHTLLDVFNDIRQQGLGRAAGRVLRPGAHRRGRHAGGDHRRVQAGHGHRLQRHLGLPSAGGVAGQHGRGAEPGQSLRQSAVARRRRGRDRSGHPRLSRRRLPPGAACAATPTSRRPSIWIAGTTTACSSSSAST